jgi:hypothetical protein
VAVEAGEGPGTLAVRGLGGATTAMLAQSRTAASADSSSTAATATTAITGGDGVEIAARPGASGNDIIDRRRRRRPGAS